MKILHACKKYPNALGGDAVVVSNLEEQQKNNGHEVVILTSNCDEIIDDKHIYKFGLKDTPAALDNITIKRLLSLILLFFTAFKVLHTERPDIIHTHSVDMAFFISFAARFYNIPIVHTFHIVTFYNEDQSPLRRKVELKFARGARPVLVTAPNGYDVKKLRGVGLNAVELPNGINLNFWNPNPKMKKAKVFRFVSVGRLEEQKGNEYLIRAVALLLERTKTEFKAIVVGTGSLEYSLKALAEDLRVSDHIEFLGRKNPVETRNIYNSAHVAVFPALYETTPLTLLEAWAMHIPVISTNVGILRDTKRPNTALITEIQDPTSLARAMDKAILDKSLRERLVHHSLSKVQELGWPKVAATAEAIYTEAMR